MSITIEHSRSREVSSSGSIVTTDEGTPSSPIEVPSLSPTTRSQEDFISDEDDWDPVDDIEPSESASRPASRPPPPEKSRPYVETGPPPAPRRESSRARLPPAPEPEPHRHSRREQREPREYDEAHRSRPRHHRRRDPSSHSDSVGSHEHYPGHGRIPYGHGPPPNPSAHQQWEFVQHHPHPGYASSSIGSQGPVYNPFTGTPMPNPGQLIQYQQPHPAYYPPNPLIPQYSHTSPLSPTPSSHSSAYFDPHRMPPPMPVMPMAYYPSYPMPHMQGMQPMASPPPGATPAEEEKFKKLQDMLLAQEKARMAREDEREAKMEAARQAAEADAARKASEKEAALKLADAEKKAKADAEAEAEAKAKTADEKHKKALEEMKKKADAAEKAEKEAKKAEEEAKKEAAAARGPETPIKFKDAVGRTFSFPWPLCKTWKGMEGLIKQAFLHVEVIGQHVQEGHYDLMGPNGEIILPQVWENTVQPDWTVTMHMWPMAEEKKEAPKHTAGATVVSRTSSSERGLFGRRKSKKGKSPPVVAVPARRPSNAGALPPPPPPAPLAPPTTVLPDAVVVDSSGAAQVVKEKRAKSKEPVPPLLAWSAASMTRRRTRR